MRVYRELVEGNWAQHKFVCVGLDSEFAKIPETAFKGKSTTCASEVANTIAHFNLEIVRATRDIANAFKLNYAFYAMYGRDGIEALNQSIRDIHIYAPEAPVILDIKDMDIGNTNNGYVKMAFDYFRADAVTINPYLGRAAAQPFLDRKEKGIIVLCRASNPGAGEFQDLYTLQVNPNDVQRGMMTTEWLTYLGKVCRPLYERVAKNVVDEWNMNQNCSLVVGATCPEELARVRKLVGDMPLLIPGIGAQGGDVEKTIKAGKDSRGKGMLINSSRGIIFASNGADFAEAARRETLKLHSLINQYLN